MSPATDTYRPLVSDSDRDWFHENEAALESGPTLPHFKTWCEQAAWLTILKVFDDHPTIEEISFDVDEEDPDRYVFVQTRREGQDDFNGLGEDPEEVDENLQSYLNDMGRNAFVSFHRRLARAQVIRSHLDDAGENLVGVAWVAHWHESQMHSRTPQPQDPTGPSHPRL